MATSQSREARYMSALQEAFNSAKEFSLNGGRDYAMENGRDYAGLLVLVGPRLKVASVVDELNGELLEKYGPVKGLLFRDEVQKLYREMAPRDGGLAFDLEGSLLGTEVNVERVSSKSPVFKETMGEVRRRRGSNGRTSTRHMAGISASIRGVPSVVASEERGTVMAFYKGRLLDELYFDPLEEQYAAA